MILMMTQHFIKGKRVGGGAGERLVRYRPVVGLLHGSVFTDCLLEQVLGNGDLSLRSLDGNEPLCVARLRFFDHDGGLRVVADLSYPLPPGSCNMTGLSYMLEICDILVRIRISTSDYGIRIRSQLWIRLLSSVNLRMIKYFFSHIFFLVTYVPAEIISSVLKIYFFAKIL